MRSERGNNTDFIHKMRIGEREQYSVGPVPDFMGFQTRKKVPKTQNFSLPEGDSLFHI